VLLATLAFLLIFTRLDDVYLWQDEAETALVARHMVTYGLPLSTDGRTWIQQEGVPFREYTADYVWIYHPWLQYLVTAISFSLLGQSTLSARLPFALAGLLAILMQYVLASRWQPDRKIARVGAVLLLFCVPGILLARQCRYYSLSALLTLLVLDSYLRLDSARPWALPYFVLSAVLLFHTEYAAFFPVVAALLAHALLTVPGHDLRERFLPGLLLIGLLALPWTSLIPIWHGRTPLGVLAQSSPAAATSSALARIVGLVGEQLLQITVWIFPLILVPATLAGLLAGGRSVQRTAPRAPRLFSLIILVIALHVVALSFVGWSFFRYLTHLIPLLLILLAVGVVWLMTQWRVLGYLTLAALITTNILHILPYRLASSFLTGRSVVWTRLQSSPATRWMSVIPTLGLRSDLLMYAQELTHDYLGPTEGLVAYLGSHALPGQQVLVNAEDLPLQFYTDLRVFGGLSGRGLGEVQPDWIIDRRYGHYRDQLVAIVDSGPYERITIPYPDLRWENREEASQHQFLTDMNTESVVLYRRLPALVPDTSERE
jgi:4-amino-4-deoxy-L-arabinose transferase-like glycosyltransferase